MKKFFGCYYYDCVDVYTGEKYTLIQTGENSVTNKQGDVIHSYCQALTERKTGKIIDKPYYITKRDVTVKFENGICTKLQPGNAVLCLNGFKVVSEKY